MKGPFEDDISLVEGCLKKDLAAWQAFTKKYASLISISIETRLKKYGCDLPHQDIEDIRQDVLTSIWRDAKLESVRNRECISYWLAIVAGNSAIDYIRMKGFQPQTKSISLFQRMGESELMELIPSTKLNPKDEFENFELSKRIDEAIESLPAKERLIIKLNLLHDKKHDDIAKMLNLPKGTVYSYIKRAKGKLRELLKEVQ